MDWLRRNWPDLLIGLALLAVIAGIIATLLSGGSLLPLGRGASDDPGRVVTTPQPSPTTTRGTPAGAEDGAVQGGTPSIIPILPDIGGAARPQQDPVRQGASQTQTPQTPRASEDQPQATSPSGAGRETGGEDDFSVSPSSQGRYRVSAGAFGIADYARTQVERLEGAGYPVFTARQGDLYLVMVGPYASQSDAQRVAGQLERDELVVGPIVYECADCAPATDSDDTFAEAAVNSRADSAVAGPASSITPAASTTSSRSSSSGPLYLQVGAYVTLESSEPQRERMQELGYTVTVRRDNGLVKLLIGPFDGGELASAQERLAGQGIENFPTP